MTERTELERLLRDGIDTQTMAHAGMLMRTYLAPNQPRPDERFAQGLRNLAEKYRRARELLAVEFRERPPTPSG